MAYVGYNEAKKRANEKYLAKFAEIRIRISPEFKKQIEAVAYSQGKSVQAFVIESLTDKLKKTE